VTVRVVGNELSGVEVITSGNPGGFFMGHDCVAI
jgi:hypothetical protein